MNRPIAAPEWGMMRFGFGRSPILLVTPDLIRGDEERKITRRPFKFHHPRTGSALVSLRNLLYWGMPAVRLLPPDRFFDRATWSALTRASPWRGVWLVRSEEHTSELQSLMRISYAVFCLKKKKQNK